MRLKIAAAIGKILCAGIVGTFSTGCDERRGFSESESRDTNTAATIKTAAKADSATGEAPIITNAAKVDLRQKRDPLVVWQDATSTPEERADAVNRLLSPETSINSAKALLGAGCVLSHYYGPSLSPAENTNGGRSFRAGYIDVFHLEYDSSRGRVVLSFEAQGTNEFRFRRAYVGEAVAGH